MRTTRIARGRRAAAAFGLLAAFGGAAPAQDDRAPTRDHVSIQERPGFLEAVNRIANGDEAGGIAALEQIVARYGGDPDVYIARYNLACGRARRGELDPAFTELERAVELGYALDAGQLDHLEKDPDLEPLRRDPRFAALLARARARAERLAPTLENGVAPFVWTPPPAPEAEKKGGPAAVPLLIALHGYGGSGESFAHAGFLQFCQEHRFALLAPSGALTIATDRHAWFRGEADFINRYRLVGRAVWYALEDLRKRVAIDPQRIYLTGLGEGAALGFALALRNPQWVRGAVLFGGGYAPVVLEDWEERAAKAGRRIALVHGKEDALYPVAPLAPFVANLREKGLSVELLENAGGHELPDAAALGPLLLERIAWIDAAPGRPAPDVESPPRRGR